MSNVKNTVSNRLLAALVSLAIAISVFPVSILAADPGDSGAVTVIVTDTESNPIQGATVTYKVAHDTPDESVAEATATTDADGKAELASPQAYAVADGNKIYIQSIVADGYVTKESSEFTEIAIADVAVEETYVLELPNITDVEITPAEDLTYTGEAQTTVSIAYKAGDIVSYKDTTNTVTTVTTGVEADGVYEIKETDSGNYSYEITVERTGFETFVAVYDVSINSVQGAIAFVHKPDFTETVEVKTTYLTEGKEFDFSAKVEGYPNAPIEYSVTTDGLDSSATIGTDGKLNVKGPGKYTVKAKTSANYGGGETEYTFVVKAKADNIGDFIGFDTVPTSYVVGTNADGTNGAGSYNWLVSNSMATSVNANDDGNITYYIDDASKSYLEIGDDGKVKVKDYIALLETMSESDKKEVAVTVTAKKDASTYYLADEKDYEFNIVFDNQPQEGFVLDPLQANENGWYKTAVKLKGFNGYFVALADDECSFVDEVELSDNGTNTYEFYMQNQTNGAISEKTSVELSIDTEKPDPESMGFEFPDTWQWLKDTASNFGKFWTSLWDDKEPNYITTIKFKVNDELGKNESGLSHIDWVYTNSDGVETLSGKVDTFTRNADGYVAEVEFDKSLLSKGNISFVATDKAGNKSTDPDNSVTANSVDVVVDSAAPLLDVTYNDAVIDDNECHYYKDNIVATITIKEDNGFDSSKVIAKVNGKENKNITWASSPEEVIDGITYKVNTGTLVLKDEGEYGITVDYKDLSGNTAETHTAENLIIDRTSPLIDVEYSEPQRTYGGVSYYNDKIEGTITIVEKNFDSSDVAVEGTIVGVVGYPIENVVWENGNNPNEYIGKFIVGAEAEHRFYVGYTDKSGNIAEPHRAQDMTIDKTAPTISVGYENNDVINTLTDADGNEREYFDATQTAEITITERNFNADDVMIDITAKDISGEDLELESLIEKAEWETDEENSDIHRMTITYPGDANYTFDVEYADLATNAADDYTPDYFTVDKTAPETLAVSYSTSVLDTVLESVDYGFYNAKMTVTITAQDDISGVHSFLYSYLNAKGVSTVNAQLIDQAIAEADIKYSDDGKTATATFEIPKLVLANDNQFNGTVTFTATDRAAQLASHKETKRIVVDNIAPTIEVGFNTPVLKENNISYYDGRINATVTINEANFYSNDVVVTVTKDGASRTVTPTWTHSSVDVHTGTFALTEDGDYVVTVAYKDKSGNTMATYKSNQLTIDTDIAEPVITVNGSNANGQAFKGDVMPAVTFEDDNFDSYEITLTRTNYGSKNVDVTTKFIGDSVTLNENGGTGTFDTFEKIAENDGIYTMTVSMTDKAGHTTESSLTFTINRFGSVYEYSDYLVGLIKDGGAYIESITDDLIITEYNADRLLAGSLVIEITRDGKPIENVVYDISPVINDSVSVGSSGWFQYQYTISKANFEKDGIYKISVSSKDATGNTPETSNYDDKAILFRVDSTRPEITSIIGLEESIINATEVEVKFTVFDTMGLKSIKVYVDGELVKTITDFGDDLNNYTGSFVLLEDSTPQSVQIVVEDISGNITDTASEDFESAYVFNDSVTVSTNIFVRWYANKPLFWGSIAGVIGLITVFWFIIAKRRKEKEEEQTKAAK